MPPVRPASRADRLELLARVLGDRPGATAADLARELGVSTRSVFRDLDALRERGYPVESARGRGGGLRLHPNWGLGRVLLSRDEALCALLGLAVAEKLRFPMFAPEDAREDGAVSHRRLEPHALVINWPAWYLMAHDHLRGESRTFRLDRFVTVAVEAGPLRS